MFNETKIYGFNTKNNTVYLYTMHAYNVKRFEDEILLKSIFSKVSVGTSKTSF